MLGDIIDKNKVADLEVFLNRFGVDARLKDKTAPDGSRVLYFKHLEFSD